MNEAPIETIYSEAVKLQDELEAVAKAYHLAITDLKWGNMTDERRLRPLVMQQVTKPTG